MFFSSFILFVKMWTTLANPKLAKNTEPVEIRIIFKVQFTIYILNTFERSLKYELLFFV